MKPEDKIVEIEAGRFRAMVCEECLALIIVHRRIHHMKIEKLIPQIAKR